MYRFITVCVLVLAMTGCCSGPDVQEALQDGIAANAGHMNDQDLPQEAREIAMDNHDLLWDIRFRTGGVDELPADVRERKDARAAGGGQ